MKLLINSNESLAQAVGTIKTMYSKHKYLRLDVKTGRDRTLSQNDLFHAWVQQLTDQGGEHTFAGYRNFCRLHFFVPILRAENDEFRAVYDKCLKGLPYDTKLEAMSLVSGLSSICTTEQFSKALEQMQKHFATLATDCVFLEFPEDGQ
jgi:hypothetical protein